MRGVICVLIAVLAHSTMASADTTRLLVSLDVPEHEAPMYLCVITAEKNTCKADDAADLKADCSRPLNIFGDFPKGDAQFPAPTSPLPSTIASAVEELRRVPESTPIDQCSGSEGLGCLPKVTFSPEVFAGRRSPGFIRCTRNPTATQPKVALVYLYSQFVTKPLKKVELRGTTATLNFTEPIKDSEFLFAEVVGGHYKPSGRTAIGTLERISVPLQPRCVSYVPEIPKSDSEIALITFSTRSTAKKQCTVTSGQNLELQIPYDSVPGQKTLSVTYKTQPETESRAVWTTPLPPTPLQLGVRSFRFSWRRPASCLAETWREQVVAESDWSASCPRATVHEGATCELLTREALGKKWVPPESCDYSCTQGENLPSLTFPVAMQFDRVRRQAPAATPVTIYSWTAQVLFSGQPVTTIVEPKDRRVMLELEDPELWTNHGGITFDAIRLVTADGQYQQLDLSALGNGKLPPRWMAFPTPGRTCSDPVRLAIFGSRGYTETSPPVLDGRILIGKPSGYQFHARPYAVMGLGLQFQSIDYAVRRGATSSEDFGEPYFELGIGGKRDLPGPWSLGGELTGQLSNALYGVVELPGMNGAPERLPYIRLNVRALFEWWATDRLHPMASLGVSLGFPLDYRDDERGKLDNGSVTTELGLMVNIVRRRLWLTGLFGLRLWEDQYRFRTDFTDEPTPNLTRRPQYYFALRFTGRGA